MAFQSRAVLALCFEFRLEFLDEQFEPPDFVAQFLDVAVRSGRVRDWCSVLMPRRKMRV